MRIKFGGRYVLAAIIAISFAFAIFLYPFLPQEMVMNFGPSGEARGVSSRGFAAFFLPIINFAIVSLLLFLPKIDPLKENIFKIKKLYDGFIVIFSLFLFLIQMQIFAWNFGVRINNASFLSAILIPLFAYLGFLCLKVERNWTIGFRTAWALSDENVWRKTNDLGGKLFIICAGIAVPAVFFPKVALFLIIPALIISAVITIIYSYVIYSRKI